MWWHTRRNQISSSAKRTSPFKSAGATDQSAIGSRGVRTSGSNAGYTMIRGSVKSTGYPLHSPVSPSLPLPCVTVCHHISTGLYQTLPNLASRVDYESKEKCKPHWISRNAAPQWQFPFQSLPLISHSIIPHYTAGETRRKIILAKYFYLTG